MSGRPFQATSYNILIVLLAISSGVFLAFPYYDYFIKIIAGEVSSHWHTILLQSKDLSYVMTLDPGSHDAKKALRLSLPLIASVTGAGILQLYVIQIILNFFMILMLLHYFKKISARPIIFVSLTLLFAWCYAGSAGLTDTFGWGDGFAFFFMTAAMLSRNPLLIFLSIFAGAFTDERALINSSFILIWHLLPESGEKKKLNNRALAVLLSWLAYFSARLIVQHIYGIHTPANELGLGVLINNIHNIPLALITSLKSLWFFVIIAAIFLYLRRETLLFTAFIAGILVSVLISLLVYDVSRSAAYLFPAALIGIRLFSEYKWAGSPIKLYSALVLFSMLFPTFLVVDSAVWVMPLPVYLFWYL